MPKKEEKPTIEEQLEEILDVLYQMNKRDRLRTWGSFVKGLISIVPVLVLLWSVWYAYEHGDELLRKISEQAAEQAARVTQQGSADLMDRLGGIMQR